MACVLMSTIASWKNLWNFSRSEDRKTSPQGHLNFSDGPPPHSCSSLKKWCKNLARHFLHVISGMMIAVVRENR